MSPACSQRHVHHMSLTPQSITFTHNDTSNSVFIFYAFTYLIILVENGERPFVLRFGSELKIFNVLGDDLSVCDEEPLKKNRNKQVSEADAYVKNRLIHITNV